MVKVTLVEKGIYQVDRDDGHLEFLFYSGDGYSIEELQEKIDIIRKLTGKVHESIYAGVEYEDIPFKEIYELQRKEYKIPTKREFNCYDHGFFQVLI